MLTGVLLIAGCNSSSVRRVSVAYPEHWAAGEYRNCIVDGITDVVNGLPELDCDHEASTTPRSRIFVMDVEFSGRYSGKGDRWTCQKSKESLVCRATSAAQREATNQSAARQTSPATEFEGVKTTADIAKFSFVNKRCRVWAADGDIDVDQTCLVVKTVNGGLVVIPNEYADKELQEIAGQLGSQTKDRDRWLQRFYEIGGGEKPQK
jgi:hypothetical protein